MKMLLHPARLASAIKNPVVWVKRNATGHRLGLWQSAREEDYLEVGALLYRSAPFLGRGKSSSVFSLESSVS